MNWQIYLNAFLVGGVICGLTQLVWDLTKLTLGQILTFLTVLGGILGGLGLYDKLIKFAGGGAAMDAAVSARESRVLVCMGVTPVGLCGAVRAWVRLCRRLGSIP